VQAERLELLLADRQPRFVALDGSASGLTQD
jgi:hypothetical protein